MEQITIQGQTFNVPLRYEEGHELTAGEASALNQTFHENIRNNLAKLAKEGTLTQDKVDEYASGYQFGVRSGGGGGSRDPIMTAAMTIARARVKAKLKEMCATPGSPYHGRKVSDFTSEAVNNAAKTLIDRDPKIMDMARERVAQEKEAASADLTGLIDGMATKPAEQPAAA